MKNTLFVKTTASPITTTGRFFLLTCKYHTVLLGEIEERLHKLDTFCFTYQHVDCFHTLFKYRFNRQNYCKVWKCVDNVQKAISFNQTNKIMEKMPSVAKKAPEKKV